VDAARIFVTGFSNGASMAFRVAVELLDRIAAVAPVAGHYWPTGATPARAIPTLFLIGDRDPLVPLSSGRVDTPWGRGVEKPAVRETLREWSGSAEPAMIRAEDGVRVECYGEQVEAWTRGGLGHH